MKKLLLFFAAGCPGPLVNSIALRLLGDFGINRTLGIAPAPGLTPARR